MKEKLRNEFRKLSGGVDPYEFIIGHFHGRDVANKKYAEFLEQRIKELEQSPERVSIDAVVSVPEIRNKLSPVSNLIAMIEDVNVTVSFSSREYEQMFNTEIEEVKKAVKELAH